MKKAGCGGNACDQCGHCCDWKYTGDAKTWQWISQHSKWTNKDWDVWQKDRIFDKFQRLDGSTCRDFLFHHRRETFALFNHDRNVHFTHLFHFRDYHLRRFPLCSCSS